MTRWVCRGRIRAVMCCKVGESVVGGSKTYVSAPMGVKKNHNHHHLYYIEAAVPCVGPSTVEGDHLTIAKEQDERANILDPRAVGYQVRQQRWGFTRPVGRSGLLLLLAYRVVLSVPKYRLVSTNQAAQ